MNFKPYPEYKDSSDFGDVPSHWKIKRIKNLFQVFNGSTPTPNEENWEGNIIWSTPDDLGKLKGDYIIDSSRKITSKGYQSCGTNLVPKGSIIISSRAPIGHMGIAGVDLCTNQGCKSLVPLNKLNNEYFYYLLESNKFNLQSLGQGATFTELSSSNLKSMTIIEPVFEEQNKIAEFLDKKTSEIDLTIEKDSRLIELLKEKRTALINHVVTKGLDPTAEMKDSGVEWIGEIPEGWKLKRLKYNVLVNPPGKKSISDPKSKINFLPMEKVSEDGSHDLDSKTEYEKVCSGYTYFEDNDVLLAKITPCFENGKGTLVENLDYGFGFGTTEFHVFRSSNEIIPKYLYFLTKSHLFRVTGEAFMEGAAGQKRVSTDFVKNFRMPTPPDNQQYQIIEYLDQKTSEIDLTIQKIQEHIKLLVEYKKSLIHHVVTGKVDVREVAV
ncbi:MAG: restriction endonuclease subunit S [Methanobacterium sp.]|uniref:restriction endonuclease subunit S n=1 Tax=Methanobacterium sp. MZD130B TaxID=3394378 RepID=UPI0039FCD3EF